MQRPFLDFTWSEDKNHLLKRQRGVAFEDVIIGLYQDDDVGVIYNHNPERHPGQDLLLIIVHDYLYAVPHENVGEITRLITIYPDGNRMRHYRRQRRP